MGETFGKASLRIDYLLFLVFLGVIRTMRRIIAAAMVITITMPQNTVEAAPSSESEALSEERSISPLLLSRGRTLSFILLLLPPTRLEVGRVCLR